MKPNFAPALIATLLLALSAPGNAAQETPPDTPAQYSHALPLQITGKQGVVGLRLPLALYQHARTAQLDDLRVFDAKGVAQPFALYRPPPASPEQKTRLPARIFPVTAPPQGNTTTLDLDIRTRADGNVIAVRSRNAGTGATTLHSLILDFGPEALGKTEQPTRIEALRFTPPKAGNYSAEVWLETSSDLKQWHTAGAAELRWLTNDNAETLASDRLEISPQSFRYARLSWRRGEALAFARIEAEARTHQRAEPPRETLWIAAADGKQAGELAYPAGIAIPVEQVALRFSEPNIVYPASIGSYVERPARRRDIKSTEWVFQPQLQATFYQITQNGEPRRSGAVALGNGHAQEWIVRPQTAGATARPELGLSWQAATLVFLNGGTPPYTLSFGRADAKPAAQALSQVAPHFTAKELGQLELAQAGPLQAGPGSAAAASAATQASQAAQQRTYLLWGVLVLGVLVLGGLAWKLVRQMKEAPPGE